jgi:hypothetical protein
MKCFVWGVLVPSMLGTGATTIAPTMLKAATDRYESLKKRYIAKRLIHGYNSGVWTHG